MDLPTIAAGVKLRAAAVLLDLDGTLVSSEAAILRAWERWCDLRGADMADLLPIYPGRDALGVMEVVAPWLGPEQLAADVRDVLAWQVTDTADIRLLPGAREVVSALVSGAAPWAIVTSGDHALATARLAAVGLPIPEMLVTADDVARAKPDPEGYRKAAAALGVRPEDCIVVEDAPAGVQAGLAAGMRVVHVGPDAPARSGVVPVPSLTAIRVVECGPTGVTLAL